MATPIEPVVQLFDVDTDIEYNDQNIINFGEVKAGDQSPIKKLRLWNNRTGTEVASTMKDVELFALDSNDAKVEPIIADSWLHVKCVSAGDSSYTRLSSTNTVQITALGQNDGEILGSVNDGTDTNTDNFAEMELYAQIIDNVLTATHGDKYFSLAFRYYFT